MQNIVNLSFKKAPSLFSIGLAIALGYRSRLNATRSIPVITARHNKISINPKHLSRFAEVCGMAIRDRRQLPLIYPMTFLYPLIQVMLAHKEAPLSVIKALNTRLEIIQHRAIGPDEICDAFCRLAQTRLVEKGLEVDLACVVRISGQIVWECAMTFFYRGAFGRPDSSVSYDHGLEAIPEAPPIARWFLPESIGFTFARLSGDGNPIHYWSFYARRFGFKRDFAQPLLVLSETLFHLENKHPSAQYKLRVAFKGPVYYQSRVLVKSVENTGSERFDIYGQGNPRPCICGNLRYG